MHSYWSSAWGWRTVFGQHCTYRRPTATSSTGYHAAWWSIAAHLAVYGYGVWGMSPNQACQNQEIHIVHITTRGCITRLFTHFHPPHHPNLHILITPKCSASSTLHSTANSQYFNSGLSRNLSDERALINRPMLLSSKQHSSSWAGPEISRSITSTRQSFYPTPATPEAIPLQTLTSRPSTSSSDTPITPTRQRRNAISGYSPAEKA
jgi:hypothetical protein